MLIEWLSVGNSWVFELMIGEHTSFIVLGLRLSDTVLDLLVVKILDLLIC